MCISVSLKGPSNASTASLFLDTSLPLPHSCQVVVARHGLVKDQEWRHGQGRGMTWGPISEEVDPLLPFRDLLVIDRVGSSSQSGTSTTIEMSPSSSIPLLSYSPSPPLYLANFMTMDPMRVALVGLGDRDQWHGVLSGGEVDLSRPMPSGVG